jgi:PAS domain S-box-containing protein
MPFIGAWRDHDVVERMRRVRNNPIAAYGTAILAVALATLLRWAVAGYTMEGVPFITYYPAIIIATFLGGFWPGVLATLSSALVAWFAFIPPAFTFDLDSHQAVSLGLFLLIAAINVGLVSLLDRAIERIATQAHNIRVVIESAPAGIVVVDDQGTIQLLNSSAEKQFGYDRSELLGKKVEVLVPTAKAGAHRTWREAFMRETQHRQIGAGRDLRGRRRDGSEFPIEIALSPIGQNDNTGVLATVIDISERRRTQDRQQFLVRELHHRSQNLFVMIQALAARSLVEGSTLAQAKANFNGRLSALARTHAMLANAAWHGAPLNEIIVQELVGFSEQVSITGCDLLIDTPATQNFALIVHELATNAVKYGALSSPSGRISITGRVERMDGGDRFSFEWREAGGPPVSEPTRKGFGSAIILEAAKQFGQEVAIEYDPLGLHYQLRVALSAIQSPPSRQVASLSDGRTR